MNDQIEKMNHEISMEDELQNARSAIQVLSNAFADYKSSTDKELKSIKSHSARMIKDPNDEIPSQRDSRICEYVTKGNADGFFPLHGGYSVIPASSFIDNESTTPTSLMRLARKVVQHQGSEHVLLEIPRDALVAPDGRPQIKDLNRIPRRLRGIELELFLESENVVGDAPANFSVAVQSALNGYFSRAENELFISDEGASGQVQGIGSLVDSGYTALSVDYDELNGSVYSYLKWMTGLLPQEYHDNAVWLMSPRMYSAISSVRDISGRFISDFHSRRPTLLGFPVYCHERFDHTHNQIIFADIQHGYTMIEYPNVFAIHDQYRDRRGVVNYFKKLIAGAVTNKCAWISLQIKKLPQERLQFSTEQNK